MAATKVIKSIIQFRRATTAEWEQYKTVVPAAGEPCFDTDLGTLKIGNGVKTYEQLSVIGGQGAASVSADGKSIVVDDGVFKLAGFDSAVEGAQPRKTVDGNIEWVVPAIEADIATLKTDVKALQDIIGTSAESSGTLISRISTLETGINTLKGNENTDGSVLKIVKDEINAFTNRVTDNDTIDTFKELVDYVATHGSEVAGITAEINKKVDKVDGKSLIDDTLITKLEGIEAGAQANKIESVTVGSTLLDIVDKQVTIPMGAGLKGSDEIEIAEDGTLGIKALSFSKITQSETEEIVFDGGGANR